MTTSSRLAYALSRAARTRPASARFANNIDGPASGPLALPRPRAAGARARGLLCCERAAPWPLGAHRLARGCRAGGCAALPGGGGRLLGERAAGCGGTSFPPQRSGRPPVPCAWHAARSVTPAPPGIPGLPSPRPARRSGTRRRKLHSGSPRLGQPDRDGLLGGPRPVLSLADVIHLLVNEFSGLGAGRFTLPRVPLRALDDVLLWHDAFLLDFE